MRRGTQAPYVVLVALLAACSEPTSRPVSAGAVPKPLESMLTPRLTRTVDLGPGIRANLPDNGAIHSETKGPDFDVYSVTVSGKILFHFYVGQHADFPSDNRLRPVARPLGSLSGECAVHLDGVDTLTRECLVQTCTIYQIHLWYRLSLLDEQKLADRIFESLSQAACAAPPN